MPFTRSMHFSQGYRVFVVDAYFLVSPSHPHTFGCVCVCVCVCVSVGVGVGACMRVLVSVVVFDGHECNG